LEEGVGAGPHAGEKTIIPRATDRRAARRGQSYGALESPEWTARIGRSTGRAPLLEIDGVRIGDAERASLAGLGLRRLWDVAVLRIDLGSLVAATVPEVVVRAALPEQAETFAALAVRAFAEVPPGIPRPDPAVEARFWGGLCQLGRARCFFAERGGAACAIGVYLRVGDAALVDGAATLREHRGMGCQSALIVHRLREAGAHGARYAISRAAAGGTSQRNLEHAGMRVCRRLEVWGEEAV
jgi:hypothetical protein